MLFENYKQNRLSRAQTKTFFWFLLSIIFPVIVFAILINLDMHWLASLVVAGIVYYNGKLRDEIHVLEVLLDSIILDVAQESLTDNDVKKIVDEKIYSHVLYKHKSSNIDDELADFWEGQK